MDLFQAVADVHRACLYDIVWLRHTDSFELYAGLGLDLLNEHLGLSRVERDASTTSTCASRSSTSVDVGLCFLGRLNLDDQVHAGDI